MLAVNSSTDVTDPIVSMILPGALANDETKISSSCIEDSIICHDRDISTVDINTQESKCYWCEGTGKRSKRLDKNEHGKRLKVIIDCQFCDGKGSIQRTKRRNVETGGWKRKEVTRSYPSFIAPGPLPFAERVIEVADNAVTSDPVAMQTTSSVTSTTAHLFQSNQHHHLPLPTPTPQPDEELCYLAGQWKVFQKLDKHRYSTDDLVTSHMACTWGRQLGYNGGGNSTSTTATTDGVTTTMTPAVAPPPPAPAPRMLDIGCGLGSVLLCNAWQMPLAACIGVEAQPSRFELAKRNIEYNVGAYPQEQQRVRVFNQDLREPLQQQQLEQVQQHNVSSNNLHIHSCRPTFDIVTGTPPYFPAGTGISPSTGESNGCLFECKGGVEEYCRAASGYLRLPGENKKRAREVSRGIGSGSDTDAVTVEGMSTAVALEIPSIFVLCNTALTSQRVYVACQQNHLSVIHRTDVVPRTGKPVLFCVFVIVRNEWLEQHQQHKYQWGDLIPPALSDKIFDPAINLLILDPSYRVPEGVSLRGETVRVLTVREPVTIPTAASVVAVTHAGNGRDNDNNNNSSNSSSSSFDHHQHQKQLHHNARTVHSKEYQQLLRDLGKPSSADIEMY